MVAGSLAVWLVVYVAGTARLWRAAGPGQGIRYREAAAFALGWVTLALALGPPLDDWADTWLAAHMVQHELLIVVAAPLMAMSAPLVAALWALPRSVRRPTLDAVRHRPVTSLWAMVTAPAVVWLLHAAALWIWHVPALYDAAVRSEGVHAAEHLCFFATAALFWWGLVHGRYGRIGYGAAVVYVFATTVQSGALGALLTVAPRVLYASYSLPHASGLTPLEDQQLAGLLMWIPAGAIFAAAGLAFLAAWIRESERRVVAADTLAASPQTTRWTRRSSTVLVFVSLVSVVGASAACRPGARELAMKLTGGDPDRGAEAIRRYGCQSCHVIPGIPGATALVGPPLTQMGARVYLAGELANTPQNMEQWIRHPRGVEPKTAMPDMGVTDADGRDITAYLYTLR